MDRTIYVGIALVAMSTLMLELVLIRIFSVTLWYHFAFMAISIALLGMGVSGIYVYIFSPVRSPENTLKRLTVGAMLFSITTVIALIVQLSTRFVPSFSPKSFFLLSQVYVVVAIPFFFGGYCISLALTQYSRHVSKLYFADLFGAGIGCFLVFPVLSVFTGPSAVVVAAVLAGVAAILFAYAADWKVMRFGTVLLCGLLLILLFANVQQDFFKIKFAKGVKQVNVVLERWNPFSRVVLSKLWGGDSFGGWSLSRVYSGPQPNAMMITIDAHAATPIYEFNGDFASVKALGFDSTAAAYHLKRSGRALIIGSGGGKDVLTALLFGMAPVYGVEINPSVVQMVQEDYAAYSGHLFDRDDVRIIVDEGRSYIARSREKFDVIQASLVDSWAATAAGAFVLTENHLYTMEAFQKYYEHLTADGILTMSRIFTSECSQTLRLVALGYEAWKACGVKQPEKHIAVIRNEYIGTVLFKKSEFSPAEISTIANLCQQLDFEFVIGPDRINNPVIEALFKSGGSETFYQSLNYNLEPPVDDKPFFFHMLRLKDLLSSATRARSRNINDRELLLGFGGLAGLAYNDNAVFVLGSLIIIVTVLSLSFIFGPLWTFKREVLRHSQGKGALLLYFTCLGVGFMMVEVPLMQKLMLFLGHPIYSLAVTLFGLLIFSGIGSYATDFIPADTRNRWLGAILLALAVLVIIYILVLPYFIHLLISIPTSLKILLVVLALFPLGFLMGMPFPMGIKLVDRKAHEMIPWVWGINGGTSVFASVFSIVVAITWGFSVAMVVGFTAYLIAFFTVNLKTLKQT
ncbi:hypothetical protein ACFL27_12585 [candidate division CSSED10-310 bacterium]|uniref:SAM-dependent methyltransferase n=1 Tax=candidate division CSSED10-310 bacterium TaxID=2855610 RepID=A0ABV6YY73_UNCC1